MVFGRMLEKIVMHYSLLFLLVTVSCLGVAQNLPQPGDYSVGVNVDPFGYLDGVFDSESSSPVAFVNGIEYRVYRTPDRAVNHYVGFSFSSSEGPSVSLGIGDFSYRDWQTNNQLWYLISFEKIVNLGESWQLLYGPTVGLAGSVTQRNRDYNKSAQEVWDEYGVTILTVENDPTVAFSVMGGYGATVNYHFHKRFFVGARAGLVGSFGIAHHGRSISERIDDTGQLVRVKQAASVSYSLNLRDYSVVSFHVGMLL